jgi:choline dehydrogenase-like flavoprotein
MNLVIGSGPAGISAAVALIDAGESVVLLDAGESLPLETERRRESYSRDANAPENSDFPEFIRSSMSANANGVSLKTAYGSDFPYRAPRGFEIRSDAETKLSASFARGGFSNVWGASILPYSEEDLADWPIGTAELAPHYRSVLGFMDLAGRADDLEKKFPLYSDRPVELSSSRQIEAFLTDLRGHRRKLERAGISYGRSRLAIRRRNAVGKSCVYCGLCMYGCPHELIYNSAQTLAELRKNPKFDYRGGILARALREDADGVHVEAENLSTGESLEFSARRLFLGAGVYSTARLMLRSFPNRYPSLTAKDSQYFLFPIFRWRGFPKIAEEPLHTLSQAFLEVADPGISARLVHLQVYSFNDLYWGAVRSALGKTLFSLARPLLGRLLSHLLIVQGYLHSDASGRLELRLEKNGASENPRLSASAIRDSRTRATLRKLIAKLRRSSRSLGGIPLGLLLKMEPVGRGFHTGGSFPMMRNPQGHGTDLLGRPTGLKRIHLVDASVFPSVPATTITLTVMANAHRIATDAIREN